MYVNSTPICKMKFAKKEDFPSLSYHGYCNKTTVAWLTNVVYYSYSNSSSVNQLTFIFCYMLYSPVVITLLFQINTNTSMYKFDVFINYPHFISTRIILLTKFCYTSIYLILLTSISCLIL